MLENIKTAQEYLTISHNGKKKTIVNIDGLLEKHGIKPVLNLLKDFAKEKKDKLVKLVNEDKTRSEVDETISVLFRLTMAIRSLERELEEVTACLS